MTNRSLGQMLREYRRLRGLEQIDLAARFSVTVRTLRRWENNEALPRTAQRAGVLDALPDVDSTTATDLRQALELETSTPLPERLVALRAMCERVARTVTRDNFARSVVDVIVLMDKLQLTPAQAIPVLSAPMVERRQANRARRES